ncbi:DNA polymerase III subunit epsilon [Parerythrobacter jejuensis]|uniref:DNA polymerase III subunit epsilon n=1 Tax=Parerythrobacter jejuensis TaxID=795812 RepID=A0A845AX06_9SPHN|nr:DNA polymerase III subunit epsilon [Parerythrobacter jejuensis]MXP30953.1 DNA polymerase III subunit epsilon [Parerythrobacter jejuensis]MXP33713.1 DNA polymerase III subunit epsilon [Parerythrobacter jejuensis]
MREIVFDTETTGLDPKTGDRMVEIGCVEMVNRVETGATFHAYYNPERDMPAGAEAVHGLSEVFLSDKPLFRDGAQDLLDFIGDAPLVAHNAGFDFGFLNTELELCGLEPVSLERMIDTVAIARKKHPGAKVSLDALCSRYGVDRSHRVKHGALLDAELLAQVYVELTGGRQIGLTLDADRPVADVTPTAKAMPATERKFREPRQHMASADEIARHKTFLEGIESPLWNA